MSLNQGRATISLTQETNQIVDDLCVRFPLTERMDAAKVGVAFAIRKSLTPSGRDRESGSGTGTTWNVGSFDNDGQLRELVRALNPSTSEDLYVLLEALMNRGLLALRDLLAGRSASSLTELLALADALPTQGSD